MQLITVFCYDKFMQNLQNGFCTKLVPTFLCWQKLLFFYCQQQFDFIEISLEYEMIYCGIQLPIFQSIYSRVFSDEKVPLEILKVRNITQEHHTSLISNLAKKPPPETRATYSESSWHGDYKNNLDFV